MIAEGNDPFETVVAAYDRLTSGESMILVAPFMPAPLVSFLERRGGKTAVLQNERGLVKISVLSWKRNTAANGICPVIAETGALDLRGLEPPEPMVRILEAIEAAKAGGQVKALLSRRPGHLVDMLTRRGFPVQLTSEGENYGLTVSIPAGERAADA